jgi:hypothetical protein
MSRPLVLAELSTGPKTHAQLHAACRRIGQVSKSVSGLHLMLTQRNEITYTTDADGTRHYHLTDAGIEAARTMTPRGAVVPHTKRSRMSPRDHGRNLGVIYENTTINSAARACTQYAFTHGSAVVVLTPMLECGVYREQSIAGRRAWDMPEWIVGVWHHFGDRAGLSAMARDISDAIHHQIDLHAASKAAQFQRTSAPIGVMQS